MILTAILILFVFSLAIIALKRFDLRPGYSWFLAVGGSLIAWFLIVFSYSSKPIVIPLLNWQASRLSLDSPALLLDSFSWPFAVALITLLTSVLLTDVARVEEIEPFVWAANLGMTGIGLLAVLADNPLTLLMAWAILDFAETCTRLIQAPGNSQRERVVVSFSVRVVGMMLVILAILRARTLGTTLEFSNIPFEASGFLILAAGMRLGVLPPHLFSIQDRPFRRGLGTITRLVPVAASTVLLPRVASVGASPEWELPLLITSALAILFAGLSWLWSPGELDGRPFWILGLSAFSVVAAISRQPFTSLVWGLTMIFSGGLLFLFSTRIRRFLWLPALGMVGLSGLPFTPSWHGLTIFSAGNFLFSITFVLGLFFLCFGYFRHMIRASDQPPEIEAWVWVVYPVGLGLLPLVHFFVIWSLGGLSLPAKGFLASEWWLGFLVFILVGAFWVVIRREYSWLVRFAKMFHRTTTLDWFYRTIWLVYRNLSRLVTYFAMLLEGDGGVLWAVLLLVLLGSILIQSSGGG
jgi:hypothetical protein